MGERIDPADLARIAEAAYDARRALEEWVPNGNPAPGFRIDHAIAVCKAFEVATDGWPEDEAGRVIKLMTDLRDAVTGARDADARFGAQQVLQPVQALYVEVDLVQRALDDARVAAERAALADLRDDPRDRTAMEETSTALAAQADRVTDPAERTKLALVELEMKADFDITLFSAQVGPIKISIGRLKTSLADIKISVLQRELYRGVIEIAQFRQAQALATLELMDDQLRALPAQMPDPAAMMDALYPLLTPLRETTTEGTTLRHAIEAALREHWDGEEPEAADGVDLTPWPSGLRLLPPPTPEDALKRVELVEVQRFEGGDGGTFGLAPLSATRFVSGGHDGFLRLWEIGRAEPLRRMEGHDDAVIRIAALDGRCVVTASLDNTLILWDTETGAMLRRFAGHEESVMDVAALSPDRFVSASRDGTARLWQRDRDAALAAWHHGGWVQGAAALSTDTMVTGGNEHGLFLLEGDAPEPVWSNAGEEAKTWKVAARDEASFLSVMPASLFFQAWSRDAAIPVARFAEIDSICQDIALLSHNRAVSAHNNGLGLWSLTATRSASPLLTRTKTSQELRSVRALPSPDPRIGRFIVGGRNGYLAYWEVRPK